MRAITVIYLEFFCYSLESFTTEKRLLCWGGVEQHIALHCQGHTPTERGRWEFSVMYSPCKADKHPAPWFVQIQPVNNGATFFPAGIWSLVSFLRPACCRNARCQGNREMSTLAWLCGYCRLSCTHCWWRALGVGWGERTLSGFAVVKNTFQCAASRACSCHLWLSPVWFELVRRGSQLLGFASKLVL